MSQVIRVKDTNNKMLRFGFTFSKGGVHLARTMMFKEFSMLLEHVTNANATKNEYIKAIVGENCLGKKSGKNRTLAAKHLTELYGLDPSIAIFRALLYFWRRDKEGQPLVALLCAVTRDAILRRSASFILQFPESNVLTSEMMEEFIKAKEADRFSKATIKSTAKNINSTWTQSGHLLAGYRKKFRSKAKATAGAIGYALFLGYLTGSRGEVIFTTDYIKLLDCSVEQAIELAEIASRRGWIIFKRVGKVMEVSFPNILTTQEMEWTRE